MLKGLHPLLAPDLLHALAAMGHGDELAIVDANFPAVTVGRRVIEARGSGSGQLLEAVLTVFPVDAALVPAILTMAMRGAPGAVPEPVAEFGAILRAQGIGDAAVGSLERHAFYARARDAFAVVRTGELRPYGNILLVKGVVNRYPP
ncbi:MAG: RbsD/FucU domain-containing protein [Casimicrobiaceae bacterium]